MALLLTGCSILNMARYNDTEHMLVNKIRTTAELADCEQKDSMIVISSELYIQSVEFYNYDSVTPYNDETVNMAKSLVEITKGLKSRYASGEPVSEEYCKIKLRTIHDSAKAIQYSVVRKPK
jgi:hypothetical protein